MKHTRRRALGQHFLTSRSVCASMVNAGGVGRGDTALEIGPGKGILTAALLAAGARVVAVEKDLRLVERLRVRFAGALDSGLLTLVESDILDFDLSPYNLTPSRYTLVSNIPYAITGAIFKKFLGAATQPARAALLVQKEVAERVVAHDGRESVLSISVKAYGASRIVRRVSRALFSPPPKVDSAILAIESISRDFFTRHAISEEKFFEMLKRGFAHKRKLLASNLGISPDALARAGVEPNARAEKLSLADWAQLVKAITAPTSRQSGSVSRRSKE